MGTTNDDFIVALVKDKIGEVMDRMDRERPKSSPQDREAATVRLGGEEVAQALASRPDLAKRFSEIAAEHFLRAVASEMRSLRS